jgi:hypothetical protein
MQTGSDLESRRRSLPASHSLAYDQEHQWQQSGKDNHSAEALFTGLGA